jgi:hypothetical protein
MIKCFEQSYGPTQGKKPEAHTNTEITVKEQVGRDQRQFRRKEIGRAEHVIIGDVILVVVVIKKVKEWTFRREFLGGQRYPEIIAVILDRCAKVLRGLEI